MTNQQTMNKSEMIHNESAYLNKEGGGGVFVSALHYA